MIKNKDFERTHCVSYFDSAQDTEYDLLNSEKKLHNRDIYNSTKWEEREKPNKMQQSDVYYQLLSQHYAHLQEIKDRVLLHMVHCSGSAVCGW